MNKKEFIEKLKGHGAWCTECHDINGEKDRYVKVAKVRELLEQLDEPQKVKVPACVAEYIEAHRKWGPEIFIGDWLADNDAVYKWLYNNSEKENNRRFLIAVKAFVEGYEVEKEQQWVVRQGGSEVWYLQGFRNSLDGDIVKQWCSYEGCIKFTDRAKAEAVALLVDGSVEEV